MARFPLLSAAVVCALTIFNTIIPSVQASTPTYIQGTDANGVTRTLLDSRVPALYSGDFGDCLGGQSLLNVTAFDAAYYADNMTVLFHLTGSTNLKNETVMIYISVFAYGENRFDKAFDPCTANIGSLCPMNASIPISAEAIIPVAESDVSSIIPIALQIPDFEGSVTLSILSNATETQIGCFQAVMRNGHSFSHPAAVSSTLGVFTFIALISSFATAIYGASVPEIRTHYAHSLSMLVVFEVFQSIFFSGTLSLNWPSVCAAFWSNFAWSAGMIYSPSMVKSVNSFAGVNGNSSQVGGAGSEVLNNNGGLQQIYGRSLESAQAISNRIAKRTTNSTKDYNWAGGPIDPGIPIPGNWTGFAGELSIMNIPAADAFLTGFLWLLILVVLLVAATTTFKWALELLSKLRWIKEDRLALFRTHWLRFLSLLVLRSMFIAFFMIMTLTLFQFSYGGSTGIIAIASIIFLIFFAGMLALVFYACFVRLRFGKYESSPDRIHFQRKKGIVPGWTTIRESQMKEGDKAQTFSGSVSFFRIHYVDNDKERQTVHEDVDYNKRFGWLSARYRRTRWWFFGVWVVYQFIRACFVGGARGNPKSQVYGLFVIEIFAFIAFVAIRPFESTRNTTLGIMLGFSKFATAGLSIAFLPQFNLARIPTTVIGVIIIVIQGLLVIAMLILIVLGAISSYMSLGRNREQFGPTNLETIRTKYYGHVDKKAADLPPPPPPPPEEPKEPYFSVGVVRRAPKIEDEDFDPFPEIGHPAVQYAVPLGNRTRANSAANSMRSNYSAVPFGARVHRASWSSRDFRNWQEQEIGEGRNSPFNTRSRSASQNANGPNIVHSSTTMSGGSGMSMAPLMRPSGSHSTLRTATPIREQQATSSNHNINNAS